MTAPGQLHGQVALVTGAGRNVGLAIAERLAADGASIALHAPEATEAQAAAEELARRSGVPVHPVAGDLADPDVPSALAGAAVERFGRVDVLVNNAAATMAGRGPLPALTLDDWELAFAVNLRAACALSLEVARGMLAPEVEQAPNRAIVNVSSVGAQRAHRGALAYDASKAGLEAATRALAVELAPHGIRVNAVAPGAIRNDRFDALDAEQQRARARTVPLARIGDAADVAAAVAFLASSDAGFVTGQTLAVDGGLLAQLRPADAELETVEPQAEEHLTP